MYRPDTTCRLVLDFEVGTTGVGELVGAAFHAKVQLFGGKSAGCAGFLNPYDYVGGDAPMVFTYGSGKGELPMPLLPQPQAGQSSATLPNTQLNPKGVLAMAHKGLQGGFDIGGLTFSGPAKSAGDPGLSCTKAKPTQPLPKVTLKDVNKHSATYGQTVSLADFAGKYLVVLTGAGWCASCVAQSEYMTKIEKSLKAQGRNDFQMVAINDKSAGSSSNQAKLAGIKVKGTFPILQGTSSVGWKSLSDCLGRKGKKNDAFIWAPDGRFIRKHEGKGTVYLNIFEDDVRQALSIKPSALDGCKCQEVYKSSQKVHHVACK